MSQAKRSARPTLWPSAEERRKTRESKREAVLAAAVRFFNQKGFKATSLEDVARALNVTKPTIYNYFKSKDEILFECILRGLEAIRMAARDVEMQGGSGCDRLHALMNNYASCMTQEFCICITRTADHELSSDSRKRFRQMKRDIDLIVRRVVQDGMDDGSINPGDPVLVTFAITGALNWIARWFEEAGPLSRDQVVAGVVSTLMQGLLPRHDQDAP